MEVAFSWFFFYCFVVVRGCDRCFAVFEMVPEMLKRTTTTGKGLPLAGL